MASSTNANFSPFVFIFKPSIQCNLVLMMVAKIIKEIKEETIEAELHILIQQLVSDE